MGKEKMENLGFTEANSWDTEENVFKIVLTLLQKKKDLYKRLVEIDKMAERNIHRMRGKEKVDNNMY